MVESGRICGREVRETYPLLRQTTGTLILGVSEQFNNTLLIRGKSAGKPILASRHEEFDAGRVRGLAVLA